MEGGGGEEIIYRKRREWCNVYGMCVCVCVCMCVCVCVCVCVHAHFRARVHVCTEPELKSILISQNQEVYEAGTFY